MDFKGINCPVCSKTFEETDDVVVCPKCGAPYHRECYKENGKCIFTDLHKEKKTYREVYCVSEDVTENDEENADGDTAVCKHCGHKNSKDSIVCEKCGEFLTGANFFAQAAIDPDNDSDEDEELEKLKEQMRNVGPVMGSANFYTNGFRFGIDEAEDHDGVTSKELADYVGGNALYYIPVFSRINSFNTSRFNFAAFLFNGAWYLYRKQYLKGIAVSLLMTALGVIQNAVMYFKAGDLWEKANTALNASETMPAYNEYISYMNSNCTPLEIFFMILPYILSFVTIVIMFVCGLTANKGYYRKALKKVRQIKENNPDDEKQLRKKIVRAGGINLGAAFSLLACESIVNMAMMFFFNR